MPTDDDYVFDELDKTLQAISAQLARGNDTREQVASTLVKLQMQVEDLRHKMDKLTGTVDGNGSPGLKGRVVELETKMKLVWAALTAAIVSMAAGVVALLRSSGGG